MVADVLDCKRHTLLYPAQVPRIGAAMRQYSAAGVPVQWPELSDEADRICANLEHELALRRAPYEPIHEDELADEQADVQANKQENKPASNQANNQADESAPPIRREPSL